MVIGLESVHQKVRFKYFSAGKCYYHRAFLSGVHCFGKCCAGQTQECGKCRDFCGYDKNGEYVVEGPIETSDGSSSGSKEEPSPELDITCTFECKRRGACSHSMRYQSCGRYLLGSVLYPTHLAY